jgi:hypothetical protein
VTAEQLQFWADDSFAGQKSDDLMPKKMRIDPFFDPSGCGVLVVTLAVLGHKGTERSLRPLPLRSRYVVVPKRTCRQLKLVISDTLAPLLYIVSNRA